MKLVPLLVRDLALDASEQALVSSCGVRVGRNIEVDLDAVAQTEPRLAARMVEYFEQCSLFWDRYAAGEEAGEAVMARRLLLCAVQSDRPGGRSDLAEEVELLAALPGVGGVIEEILSADPDLDRISRDSLRLGVSMKHDAKRNMLRVAVRMPARGYWDRALGGAHSRGETHRVLELRVSHAKWRDRKSRRLVEMKVWAEEVWPEPSR